ncbi:hypothetical protein [Thalassolituus oleivorans]|uniref:hypothetical protein n=1 Tax=Thalassolituus oleivorans TaxID=187493 RepID=UPI001B514E09|nr:hypothetical protein [Thalassolituus oleivorans]MBQ0727711.1 hypothetical protein [Thalassolituus oleivorans]MBQ0781320.1 hypothetical protein [Thalassolituus oleivorans]
MNNYAPEYTKKERIAIIVKSLLLALPIYAVAQLWFFDWLREYADNANCYYYGNITGVHLLIYSMFVGLPLLPAIMLFIFEGRRSLKVIKLGQSPLPGEKVFKKTMYTYGYKAKIQPVFVFLFIGLCITSSLWGAIQAHKLTQDVKPCEQQPTHKDI